MYECKLPFNPHEKFGNEFPDIEVYYLSKWYMNSKNKDTVQLYQDGKIQPILVSLPADKFDIHFRRKDK